jgi:hypothetical protein
MNSKKYEKYFVTYYFPYDCYIFETAIMIYYYKIKIIQYTFIFNKTQKDLYGQISINYFYINCLPLSINIS